MDGCESCRQSRYQMEEQSGEGRIEQGEVCPGHVIVPFQGRVFHF